MHIKPNVTKLIKVNGTQNKSGFHFVKHSSRRKILQITFIYLNRPVSCVTYHRNCESFTENRKRSTSLLRRVQLTRHERILNYHKFKCWLPISNFVDIRSINSINVQQDATYSVYYISIGSSTCFGCWHSSSGSRTTVIIASGID